MQSDELARQVADCITSHSREIAERDIAKYDREFPNTPLRSLPIEERIQWIEIEIERTAACILGNEPVEGISAYIPTPIDSDGAGFTELIILNLVHNSLSFRQSMLDILPEHFRHPKELIEAVKYLERGAELCLEADIRRFFRNPQSLSFDVRESPLLVESNPAARKLLRERVSFLQAELNQIESILDKQGGIMSKIASLKMRAALEALEQDVFSNESPFEAQFVQRDVEVNTSVKRFPVSSEILSARELDVLACIESGMTNQDIADELGISIFTVKNHVSSMLAKLGFTTRSQLAVYSASLLHSDADIM